MDKKTKDGRGRGGGEEKKNCDKEASAAEPVTGED